MSGFKEYLENSMNEGKKITYVDVRHSNEVQKTVKVLKKLGLKSYSDKRIDDQVNVDISNKKDEQILLSWMKDNNLYGGIRKSSSDQSWN